ncbi:MAG: NAD(P)H-dependent oxidoreductase [Clostridia bacterium]|nr:NAD(P)H-dependent oxidoreductase [Clostridia bacterium]
MNILVLNGSPKGNYSITLQTVRFLELACANKAKFEVINVGQKIRSLEKDLSEVKTAIERADVLLFAYPVYTFIAPYQLHRFIELIKESGISVEGKYATQITTSKHFYDVTAHRYVEDNCHDLGLKYIRGLSADMDDILTEKGQKDALEFFEYLAFCVENGICEKSTVSYTEPKHVAVTVSERKPLEDANVVGDDDIVILTNREESDLQLENMIERFRTMCHRRTRVINLCEYPFKGGCLGCFNCAVSGKCVYKDGFDDYLRNTIQKARAIVMAFTVKDHSMGASFKLYDDRQFCNGHRTVTMGMPMGYLVSGNYSEEFNLQMILEGRAQVGSNFLAGIATDETDPDGEIDKLAMRLEYAIDTSYAPPQNFYGVGGMKIFRDLIWLMQGMMKADHKFYKKHKQYDFPQKKRGMMLKMYLVGALISSPKIKAKMGNKMNEGMLMPYEKMLKNAAEKSEK